MLMQMTPIISYFRGPCSRGYGVFGHDRASMRTGRVTDTRMQRGSGCQTNLTFRLAECRTVSEVVLRRVGNFLREGPETPPQDVIYNGVNATNQ